MLKQWLIERYGVALDASLQPPFGAAGAVLLVESLQRALVPYALQTAVLRDAAEHFPDVAFGEACLDHLERILALERRLAALPLPQSQRAVSARGNRPPGEAYAALRFNPSHRPQRQVVQVVGDMCSRLAARGYIEGRPEAVLDLRQGLGYYFEGEDPLRRRQTVRWLHHLNELRYFIQLCLSSEHPICAIPSGSAGHWQIAASLFVDAFGRAISNANLDHGVLRSDAVRRELQAFIPLLPSSERIAM